jgi:hypothetical protein
MAQQINTPLTPTPQQTSEDIDLMILRIDRERRMRREIVKRGTDAYNYNGKRVDHPQPTLVEESFHIRKRQCISPTTFFPILDESEVTPDIFTLHRIPVSPCGSMNRLQNCKLRPRKLDREFSSCEQYISGLPCMPL